MTNSWTKPAPQYYKYTILNIRQCAWVFKTSILPLFKQQTTSTCSTIATIKAYYRRWAGCSERSETLPTAEISLPIPTFPMGTFAKFTFQRFGRVFLSVLKVLKVVYLLYSLRRIVCAWSGTETNWNTACRKCGNCRLLCSCVVVRLSRPVPTKSTMFTYTTCKKVHY